MPSSGFLRASHLRASRYFISILMIPMGVGIAAYFHDRHRAHVPDTLAAVNTLKSPALLDPKPAATLAGGSAPTGPAIPAAAKVPANVAPTAPATRPAVPATPTHAKLATPVTLEPAGSSEKLLADAKAMTDAGDLVAARSILNDPLVTGRLTEADAQAVRHALMDLNQKLVFSAKPYAGDPFEEPVMLQSGMRLQKLANQYNITWPLLCRVNGYEPTDAGARRIRAGHAIKAIKGPFCAVVNKSAFRMDLYLGGLPGEAGCTYVTSVSVGLGKDDSTPTGLWTVELHNKVRNPVYYSPRGEGVYKADDPKNPLGGYWIGLKGEDGNAIGKNSYGIHGTIEPDSIGKQSSMGCIRLGHDDITLVFDMLVEIQSRVLVQQ